MAKQDKFAQLRDWIGLSQTVLGLDHWEITVVEAASDVDAWADIEAHGQQPTADLRVSFDFWKQAPEKQRLILTHELMHLVVARYARIAENLEDALGSTTRARLNTQPRCNATLRPLI